MHNERKISEGLYYIGASDRRVTLFENVYPIPEGASYNSYLILDEKTCVLDTVDRSVSDVFYENLEYLLGDKKLDYLVVHHMEMDHAANIANLLLRHPETTIVTSALAQGFLANYFPHLKAKVQVVKEGDTLPLGKRTLHFVAAPMVHWPEVLMSYEDSEGILFSADAFGSFGALSGELFADEYKLDLPEMRRYYTNIVGKYGEQVVAVLKKAENLEIKMICPLHGPLHRGDLMPLLGAYANWATYTPDEKDGVLVIYSSVYGDTANAAEILAGMIAEGGAKNVKVYDVSKTDASYLIAECFRVKTIVLAATTYNAGVFVKMEDFLHDLANHKIRNRTIAFIENGSWAPAAKANMKRILDGLQGIKYIEKELTIASALKDGQRAELQEIADAVIAEAVPPKKAVEGPLDPTAPFSLTYGIFALSSRDGKGQDNISINNSFFQIADSPTRFLLSVNLANYSAETIRETKKFVVSILNHDTDFSLIKRFGFASGREKNKTFGFEEHLERAGNGLYYLKDHACAYFACKVIETKVMGSHILFFAEVEESKVLNSTKPLTYAEYHAFVKPKPIPNPDVNVPGRKKRVGWRCKVCGYTYWGETLPEDYVCPLCKHPASDFERIEE